MAITTNDLLEYLLKIHNLDRSQVVEDYRLSILPPETQETVGAWAAATFPGGDPTSPRAALRAVEEMVELCFACGASLNDVVNACHGSVVASRSWSLRRPESPEKVALEAADVLITLYVLAHGRGFGLHEAVNKKMRVNRGRQWKANGDGTGYHVKSPSPGTSPADSSSV